MSRPVRYIIPATFLLLSLTITGCKTIYSDVYSPKRNHFVPVKEKPKPEPLTPLLDTTTPPPSSDLPPLDLPPAAPPGDAAPMDAAPADAAPADAPMIPGL